MCLDSQEWTAAPVPGLRPFILAYYGVLAESELSASRLATIEKQHFPVDRPGGGGPRAGLARVLRVSFQ